jgi:hypothetical protein
MVRISTIGGLFFPGGGEPPELERRRMASTISVTVPLRLPKAHNERAPLQPLFSTVTVR